MALVAYDNSDSSDYEDEENDRPVVTSLAKPAIPGPSASQVVTEDTDEITSNGGNVPSLFNLLPQPSTKKTAVIEEDDEFLHKKEKVDLVKPKAKITVPSLKDFKDVDSPAPVKPKAPNNKKSGLLSILPQPRNGFTSTTTTSKSLLPHVLQQKNNVKKPTPAPPPAKKPKKPLNDYSDDSDNDEDVQNDFFSIHKPVDPIPEAPLELEESLQDTPPAVPQRSKLDSYFKPDPVENQMEMEPIPEERYYYDDASSEAGSSYSNMTEETPSNGEIAIDQEALMKLVGARSKRHREDIQMVDVNQRDLLADSREWLLKGLMDDTSKRVSSSKRKGNEPTSQQKRKHQITYLAHQAKANEAELQNQWANSRVSRRQTQNKYGF